TDEEPLTEGKLPVESMEIHNEKAHQNVRANNDFRHEKSDFDTNNDSGRERKRDSNILSKYHNIDSIKPETKADTYNYENNDLAKTNNKFDNKWDKTKNNEQFYKSDKLNKLSTNEYYIKKIVDDKPRLTPKKKPSYRNPQRELRQRNDLSPYMRTSIPYISKKGIYEDD
ncbi:jg13764, partial [Pararge aegeria aegeria]